MKLITLKGAGRGYCAGGDIKGMMKINKTKEDEE